jgi:hypothetical protein
MTHPNRDQLGAFAEGTLEGERRTEMARHLESCAECREEVRWTRELRERARELPLEAVPAPDQWSRIEARIRASSRPPAAEVVSIEAARRRKPRPVWGRNLVLAAAAVVLVALSSAITLTLARSGVDPTGPPVPVAGEPRAPGAPDGGVVFASAVEEVEEAYGPAIRELEEALLQDRDRLSPETVEVIEENLRIIDRAIRDAREALAADPANPRATRMLNGMYETKVQVLQQAASLARGA